MKKPIKLLKTLGRLFIHLLLAIVALGLFIVLAPIGVVWGIGALCFRMKLITALWRVGDYFLSIGYTIDQSGNAFCGELFNDAMITPKSKCHFGNPDETISSVLGKNKRDKTLTKFGKGLCGY